MAASRGRIFQNGTKKVVNSRFKFGNWKMLVSLSGSQSFFALLRGISEIEMLVRRRTGVYPSGSGRPDKTKKAEKLRRITIPALAGIQREMNLQGASLALRWPRGYDGIPVLGVARALLFGERAFRGYNFRCRDGVSENRAERHNEMVRNSI
jgi:hypothetical protein